MGKSALVTGVQETTTGFARPANGRRGESQAGLVSYTYNDYRPARDITFFSGMVLECIHGFPFLSCCSQRRKGRIYPEEVIPRPPHRAPSTRRVVCAAWQEKLKSRATTCSPKKLRGCSEGAGPRVGKALAPCKRGLALATLLDCPHSAHDNANKNHSVDQ